MSAPARVVVGAALALVVCIGVTPAAVFAQEPSADGGSGSSPSSVWGVIGGGYTATRGDCTFCEVEDVEAHYTQSGHLLGNIGARINAKTDAGLEVVWAQGTARGGASIRATHLLGVVQFRPWASKGFFVKGGMGMALVRNFLDPDASPIFQKALSVAIGGGWAFRPQERLGFQLYASQHAAALGDFDTREGTLENVMGNFWSVGAAIVIR